MINFRIFTENYADPNILAYYEASSEQSAFPIENAFNYQRRSKVWRSNGYHVITNSNNILHFREALGGDDLYAIMNTGTYTSTEDLRAELERAMDSAVGAHVTHTVTHDGYRFTLTSNGTMPTIEGTYLYYATSTCASVIGLTKDHGISPYTIGVYTEVMDDIVITQGEHILIDMGLATDPQAFIMLGLRNSAFPLPPTGVVKLEANETANFSSPSYTNTLTIADSAISYLSSTTIAGAAYRYWRISFDAECTSPLGYVQIGSIFLGNCFDPRRGRAQIPLAQQYIDRGQTYFSYGGQSFSDVSEITGSFNVDFYGLEMADIEELDDFFSVVSTAKPFFVSMDSGEVFSTDYNKRIILCKFANEPSWQLESPNNFSFKMSLREEL